MAIAPAHLTLDRFLALPEEEPALEFWQGGVCQKVSPKGRHAVLQAELIQRLNQYGLPGRLARAMPELRTTFGGASFVPDVAVYRWRRIAVEADGRIADDFVTPPDIAIEIVSPQQRVNALIRRCLWYVTNGVQAALLVDPDDESVIVFRPETHPVACHGGDGIDLSDILPGFALTVEQLFSSLQQT